jgi:hypothetical protein
MRAENPPSIFFCIPVAEYWQGLQGSCFKEDYNVPELVPSGSRHVQW